MTTGHFYMRQGEDFCCFCTAVSKERAKVHCSSWEPGHPSRVMSFTPMSTGSLESSWPLYVEKPYCEHIPSEGGVLISAAPSVITLKYPENVAEVDCI